MYCFVSVMNTNSFCHKIYISGKDMNATRVAGTILHAIFYLALKKGYFTKIGDLFQTL